jgi:endonuclease/exonuclease/phosphatase (EEP) superfamily protein YafD
VSQIEQNDRIAFALLLAAVMAACTVPLAKALAAPPEPALQAAPLQAPAVTPVTAPAAAPGSALTFTQQPRLLYAYLDADQDGWISLAEARRIRGFEAAFHEADENRDGRLSRDEFARAQAVHDRVRGAGYFNDGLITAQVRVALQKEAELRQCDIQIETYDGQVILAGRVDSPARARKAMEIAAAVAGVDAVKSTLEIKVRA